MNKIQQEGAAGLGVCLARAQAAPPPSLPY